MPRPSYYSDGGPPPHRPLSPTILSSVRLTFLLMFCPTMSVRVVGLPVYHSTPEEVQGHETPEEEFAGSLDASLNESLGESLDESFVQEQVVVKIEHKNGLLKDHDHIGLLNKEENRENQDEKTHVAKSNKKLRDKKMEFHVTSKMVKFQDANQVGCRFQIIITWNIILGATFTGRR